METSSTASNIWLLVAAVLGFGGAGIAAWLADTNPSWCLRPYIGCLADVVLFAAGGWLLGLFASIPSLKTTGRWHSLSWVVLVWNALGVLLCLAAILMVVFRI